MEDYLFGIRPLLESLEEGKKPEKVLIQKGLQGENFQQLFSVIRKKNIPFQMVPIERLNKITRKNHQGIIAFMPVIEYQSLESLLPGIYDAGETPLLLLPDGVTDVRNMGAIARSAECAGAHALILSAKGSAPVNADAMKASAGALSRIPVCREPNILETIAFLQECGIHVIAFDDREKASIYDADLSVPLAVIVGDEDKGVSAAARKLADKHAAIPMKGTIASLNVSVATGIILFETRRQRMNQSRQSV
ncbi:MAG: 23S rRNA (guanosine(2251)-2'-O)-methyltransferase RlmB [Bacteroidales bacterium]